MNKRTKLITVGAVALAAAAGGTGLAVAGTTGDDGDEGGGDESITGSALERAESAALAETGAGKVTETEVGDEESRYEVEVTLPDGTQTDVQLDGSFQVVGSESDAGDDE